MADAFIPTSGLTAFLIGGGDMGERCRRFDWGATTLGPPEGWSQSLKSYVGLMLTAAQPMFMAWGEDRVWLYNDAFTPILGLKHPDALGRPSRQVWAEAWADLEPLFDKVFGGEPVQMEGFSLGLDRRGKVEEAIFDFSYTPVRGDDGAFCGLFGVCIETTARVIADRERQKERALLWSYAQDLLVVIDSQGEFKDVSSASQLILGYAPEEMVGRKVFDFLHPEDVEPTVAAIDLATSEALPTFVNRYRHKDGSYRWLSWVAAPDDASIYATARDITQQREQTAALSSAQEALRQSQKMEAVGQLTGGVAHDFNNLLTVIRGSAELLRRPDLPEERRTRYIDAISDTSARATKLTNQLLAFARRQTLKPEVFDAVASVGMVTSMVQTLTGARIEIATRFADGPWWVNADRSQFDTALVNMAVNARDAMSGEGRLTIEVRSVPGVPAVRGHTPVDGSFVAVSLSDTGSGIPADRIERIFEPFFTTKAVGLGTGLGLSQVFGFVKQSGGEVDVVSETGRGTTFTLYLPRVDAPEGPAAEATPLENLIDGQGACVLVVEDNAEVGAFATQALGELGYNTVLAGDAEAALGELERGAGRFDVVFSDVVMPGMGGIELGQEIRRRHPALPVLLTSGYSHVLAQNGTHGFELLHKPYSIEELSRVLWKAVSWRTRASSPVG